MPGVASSAAKSARNDVSARRAQKPPPRALVFGPVGKQLVKIEGLGGIGDNKGQALHPGDDCSALILTSIANGAARSAAR
jgi:hypothetical protein